MSLRILTAIPCSMSSRVMPCWMTLLARRFCAISARSSGVRVPIEGPSLTFVADLGASPPPWPWLDATELRPSLSEIITRLSTRSRNLVGAACGFGLRRLRRGVPAGTNDSRRATNDSAHGDFGPYYPGGTGCRMETVKLRSRKVRINTVGERGPWTTTIVKER
jgi:hypothetical protein